MPPFWLHRWPGPDAHRDITLFVTWRLQGRPRTLEPAERELVCQVLRHGDGERYRLRAFVVMDDHVHVIVTKGTIPLERVVHSWKAFTAHEMQRIHRREGTVWGDDALQVPVTTDGELRRRTEYVVGNPWKRWPFLRSYPWVWEAPDSPPQRATLP